MNATAHVGIKRGQSTHAARLAAIRAEAREQVAPDLWKGLEMTLRIILVMLTNEAAAGDEDKARRIARQPWGSFTPSEQLAMASTARLIRSSLEHFAAVA